MSIFDFFRRKKKEKPIEAAETGKITPENISTFADKELKSLNEKEELVKGRMINLVSQFSSELKEKIAGLKTLNLDSRREEQRLKDIVMTNLYDYISYLEKLTEDMEKTEQKEAKAYIEEIQSVFNRFTKNSRKIYDKATILIGKELAEVKNLTKKFAKDFNEQLASNRENFEKTGMIKSLQAKLKEVKEVKEIQIQIENSLSWFNTKISRIKEKMQSAEKEYEEYKKSKGYEKFMEEQEKIKNGNRIISEEALKLKQEINLRELAKNFHNDSKKNSIIKKYSENFYESLKQDSDFEIISLLKEANKSSKEEELKALRQKILEQKNPEEDGKTKEFNNLLSNLESELKEERRENEKEKEKILKFENKQKQLLANIEEMAKKIWQDFKI